MSAQSQDRRYFAANALLARGAGRFQLAQDYEEIASGFRVGGHRGSEPDSMASLDAPVPQDVAMAAVDMMATGRGLDEVSS